MKRRDFLKYVSVLTAVQFLPENIAPSRVGAWVPVRGVSLRSRRPPKPRVMMPKRMSDARAVKGPSRPVVAVRREVPGSIGAHHPERDRTAAHQGQRFRCARICGVRPVD